MSNYIYANGELYHFGVKGMKWGVRKADKRVTVSRAVRNASKAAEEARKKSIAESRASGDKGIGSFQRANRKALNAKRKAYGESMAADREHNKQIKAEKKAAKIKNMNPNRKREIAIGVGAAAGTALAAYGAYKLSKAIKDKHFKDLANQGMTFLQHKANRGDWRDDDFDYIKDVFNEGHMG